MKSILNSLYNKNNHHIFQTISYQFIVQTITKIKVSCLFNALIITYLEVISFQADIFISIFQTEYLTELNFKFNFEFFTRNF